MDRSRTRALGSRLIVACAAIAAPLLATAPSVADTVRWRADGNACQCAWSSSTCFPSPEGGVQFQSGDPGLVCALPWDTDLTIANVEHVNVRGHLVGSDDNEVIRTTLFTHAYNSLSFDECEHIDHTQNGGSDYWLDVLDWGSCSRTDTWTATLQIEFTATGGTPNGYDQKAISVYSDP